MNPLVSVIIPVYNNAPYLCQCLDSVVNQTLNNIEIICVDDESTDDSLKIITKYAAADSRIKVYQQKNKGSGAARNHGLSHATGKYLYFMDSDDYCDINLLRDACNQAEYYNADVVYFGFKFYNNSTNRILNSEFVIHHPFTPVNIPFNAADCPDYLIDIVAVFVWNKIFRKSFIDNLKLKFMEIHNNNDVYFSLAACYSAQRIVVLNKLYYYYRIGITTNLQSGINKSPFDNYHVYLKLKNHLSKSNEWELVKTGFINKALSECVLYLDRFYTHYPAQYCAMLKLYVEEGFTNLGITNYPKKLILDKWGYLLYREYLKEYTTGIHRIDSKLFKLKKYIYRFPYYICYIYKSLSRFGIGTTLKKIYNLVLDRILS